MCILTGCGTEKPSFTETKEHYAVAIESSAGGSDATVTTPTISTEAVDKILSDMDQGTLSDTSAWNPLQTLAADGTSTSCNIVPECSESDSSKALPTSNSGNGDDDSEKNGNVGNGHGKGKTKLAGSGEDLDCKQRYTKKIHDGDDDADTHLRPSHQEDLACGKIIGVDQSQIIHISGNLSQINIRPTSVIALKINGNLSKVSLDLSKTTGSIQGICLFLAGNQPNLDLDLGVTVGRLLYVARGNRSLSSIRLEASGDIRSSFFDLRGNSPSVVLSGASNLLCSAAAVFGDRGLFTCGI
jgi:hypothetical protein